LNGAIHELIFQFHEFNKGQTSNLYNLVLPKQKNKFSQIAFATNKGINFLAA
jgi:hypothetical protein